MNFVGAYERLSVRLDLTHRKGDTDALYQVTINTPQRMTGIPIMVTRPKPQANVTKYKAGDRVAIGLTSFSVLPNYTLDDNDEENSVRGVAAFYDVDVCVA